MICKEFTAQIDRYLRGELSTAEQETFEEHYFACDGCFSELQIAERLHAKEIHIVTGSTNQTLQLWWQLHWKPMLSLAAMVLVTLISLWTITSRAQRRDLIEISDIPAPLYMKMETRAGLDSNHRERELKFDEAMAYYNQKKYGQALRLMNQIAGDNTNVQLTFFQSICLLFTDQPEEAVTGFDTIITVMNPAYYDEAVYYKAIALLRLDKKSQALVLLENLAEMFSPYSQKAKALMDKLKVN